MSGFLAVQLRYSGSLHTLADIQRQLQAVMYMQFLKYGGEMSLDGTVGNVELTGDDFVAFACRDHMGDFPLALGKSGQGFGRRRGLGIGRRGGFYRPATQALQQLR